MKIIQLNHGKVALVDDADYNWLNQWKWHIKKAGNTYYAKRNVFVNGVYKTIKMHRQILGLTNPKILGDHIDHDGLNNQRFNLRVATPGQNSMNTSSSKKSGSIYLGVSVKTDKRNKIIRKYWYASIKVNKKHLCLGQFKLTLDNEIIAAKAYDEAAKKYFGEFANLNFK